MTQVFWDRFFWDNRGWAVGVVWGEHSTTQSQLNYSAELSDFRAMHFD